jgi:hypothetical protein
MQRVSVAQQRSQSLAIIRLQSDDSRVRSLCALTSNNDDATSSTPCRMTASGGVIIALVDAAAAAAAVALALPLHRSAGSVEVSALDTDGVAGTRRSGTE